MSADVSSQPKRVALVHDWLTGMRGGERVLERIAALFPRAPIYSLFHFQGSVSREIESHAIVTSFLQEYPGLRSHYRHLLPLFPAAIGDFDFSDYDLVISTSHCVAKGARPRPGAFHLCYCHTPMRYAWDQEEAYFPDRSGPTARLRSLVLGALRDWDVRSASRVDLYVANSSFVARRIQRYYGRPAEIIHPPVDIDYFTPVDAPTEDYCLMVSALSPYKRVATAIEACERLGIELRIVGDGPERGRLEHLAGARTRLLGWVERRRLRELYRHARFFVQPGIEDFGIASVEALASGCPVVALAEGGVLDIVEDGEHGVLYAGGQEPETLTAAIDKSLRIRFNKLNLKERAERFSAPRFENQLRDLLLQRFPGWSLD